MILYINSCIREQSRTRILAENLLSRMEGHVEEVSLKDMDFPKTDEEYLALREKKVEEGKFEDPLLEKAKQFAMADEIVVAAPYWDLSFPSVLKRYLEVINVVGVTFYYSPEGVPVSLCKAKRLFYVTTAGGDFFPYEYGFGYVKALAENFYGISDVRLIKATGLDIVGADEETIMKEAISSIEV